MAEKILVYPLKSLPQLVSPVLKTGIIAKEDNTRELFEHLKVLPVQFMDRELAELNEEYIQPIPYLVLFRGREVFIYKRTKKGGEKRLSELWSLGLGGHINDEDLRPHEEFKSIYLRAVRRELREEVGIDLPMDILHTFAGVIHERSTAVGRVHFGLVHFIKIVPGATVELTDDKLTDGQWIHVSELKAFGEQNQLEPWSKLIVDAFWG